MFGLGQLLLRPLPVEAEHGDAPPVHDGGIDLAIAVAVGQHLPAAREPQGRSPEAPVVVLQLLAVAAAVELVDAAHEAVAGHVAAAPGLEVIAAGEVELPTVEPPRHVDVHAARPVLVERRQAFELRYVALHAGAGGVGEVAADRAARVGQTVGMARRFRVQEQPRGLARAGRQHHHLRLHLLLAAGGRVHVGDGGGQAFVVGQDLAGHGAGQDLEPPRRERGGQQDRRGREVRGRRAAAAALTAVVTGRAAAQRPGQDRHPRRYARDLEPVAGLLDQPLVGARGGRRLEDAVGLVFQPLARAEQPDHLVELVVVGLDVVVGEGPVVAQPVAAAPLEVPGTEAQRDAAPVVRASSEHARPPPEELLALGHRVGLALQVPAAEATVELPERLQAGAGAPPRGGVGPGEHRAVLGRVPHRPCLQERHPRAALGEHLGRHAPAGPRAHHADVVLLRHQSLGSAGSGSASSRIQMLR